MNDPNGYKPISHYGLIGNLRTAALVGKDGAIDWCCFPRLDSPSVFAAILDHRKGGLFKMAAGEKPGRQEYLTETNVLITRFELDGGEVTITDFMPLFGDIDGCKASSQAPPEIHRILECLGKASEVEVEWSPRFDYARARTRMERKEGGWVASGGGSRLSLGGWDQGEVQDREDGPVLRGRISLRPGERKAIVLRWGSDKAQVALDDSLHLLGQTTSTWKEWAHREGLVEKRVWAGERQEMVTRSALIFKLMTYAETGAIAAAPTTSLPEEIGGVRNWDYRYAWIRDAGLTAQALVSLGHESEAVDLLEWFERVAEECHEGGRELQIMYGLSGEKELDEHDLEHLEGYKGSRPVNIGNGAAKQFQLEVYGEIVSTAYELARRGEAMEDHVARFVRWVADHVVQVWEKPDQGIWEMRCGPRHFVYSKVMAWTALDRAVLLSEQYGLEGDVSTWRSERDKIREQVLEKGFDRDLNSFVQSYGSRELDAANLRIALVEFLPAEDPRIQGTIDRTLEELTFDGLVCRYVADDGLPGKEGAFGLCTFWLVDVLALSGRMEEARSIFDRMADRANPLGLFPEQIDHETGEFLGNFPQAFTHIGFINSALYLAYAEGREVPEHHPVGTPGHREKRRAP